MLQNHSGSKTVAAGVAELKRVEGAGEEEIMTTFKYVKDGHKGEEKDLNSVFILGRQMCLVCSKEIQLKPEASLP